MKKAALLVATGSTLVFAGTIATPAFAQDSDFTGPRVEVLGGYDIVKAGDTVDNDANTEDDESIDGFAYGVGVGYDYDLGSTVFGIEGEYTDSTGKTEFSDGGDFENFGLGSVEAGRDFYVGARAGIKATPSTLVYAKAGYTNARFNVLATDGVTELSRNIDTDGYRVGAGIEQKLSGNAYAKVEYRYSNYSEAEIDYEDEAFADSDRFDIDTDRHQIMAGVGMRF